MVYQTGNMLLQEKQKLYQGKVNDVIVCQDLAADVQTYYTVLIIKDHKVTKQILKLYKDGGIQSRNTFVADFTWQEYYLMVFHYQKDRPIEKFFLSDVQKREECEQLCMHIVMECMSAGIPYPILYLQLRQQQLHIQKDGSVYFGYKLDLEQLSLNSDERACASLCAKIIFQMIDNFGDVKTVSYHLLEQKTTRNGYMRFSDLYKDLKTAAVAMEKQGGGKRIKALFRRNQDKIFRWLLVGCIILGIISIIMILSQIFFADIPLIRLFINTYKKIGNGSGQPFPDFLLGGHF